MSEIHAVSIHTSRAVYMAEHCIGGNRKIEQSVSLYRFAAFRFPRYLQRAGRALYLHYLPITIRLTFWHTGSRGGDSPANAVATYYTFPRASSASGLVSH
jgi:hypothetical protein